MVGALQLYCISHAHGVLFARLERGIAANKLGLSTRAQASVPTRAQCFWYHRLSVFLFLVEPGGLVNDLASGTRPVSSCPGMLSLLPCPNNTGSSVALHKFKIWKLTQGCQKGLMGSVQSFSLTIIPLHNIEKDCYFRGSFSSTTCVLYL